MKIPVDKIVIWSAVMLLCQLYCVLIVGEPEILTEDHDHVGFTARDMYVELPDDVDRPQYEIPQYNAVISYHCNWFKPCILGSVEISGTRLKLTYLGRYYITAYSPQETGSWSTASGITLHRADHENRYTEPTTCAIDRSIHRFGDLFYIPDFDRVFIAEDTGGAVRGKHLDLGYTDLESVWSFPTGYYDVYRPEIIEYSYRSEDLYTAKDPARYMKGE